MRKQKELETNAENTWCPGCPNIAILESARQTILKLMKEGYKRESFAMAAGIGCYGKIFDYLDISGVYGLHGRAIPTALGIKLGNPNLNVLIFSGDGDSFSEGLEHFMSAGRFNANLSLFVHDNQSFSLTTGQSTPTSQKGFKTKAKPFPEGEFHQPQNPLLLALASQVSFVARCNARDVPHTIEIMEAAIKHPGFAFVDIIQDCIIFNTDVNHRDKLMYKIPTKKRTLQEAIALAMEYDYNLGESKIPLGIFYQEIRPTLEEQWPQLANLKKKGIGWNDVKR